MIMKRTAVHQSVVTDGYIIADVGWSIKIGAMNYRPILDIGVIADPDIMHISPDHCVKPNRAIIAHHNIADDGRIVSNETIVAPLRRDIFNGQDRGHI